MFSELPKLFGRNFAIAYFLPVSIFLTISWWLLEKVGLWSIVSAKLTGNILIDTTLIAFIAWVIGILLLVLNYDIYRVIEGYGTYNPIKIFEKRAKKKYNQKLDRLDKLDENTNNGHSQELLKERDKLMQELADHYPDDEALVMPTAFGNTLRAFEIYPRVMYGMESIDVWPRIQAVLPKEYRELIDEAKAQVDWWVNLGVLSLVFLIEFWAVIFYQWGTTLRWFFIALNIVISFSIFGLLTWIIASRATSAAVGWGYYVKSAFDLYRFALIEQLGIIPPKDREQELAIWKHFSQAIIYRRQDVLPPLKNPEEIQYIRLTPPERGIE